MASKRGRNILAITAVIAAIIFILISSGAASGVLEKVFPFIKNSGIGQRSQKMFHKSASTIAASACTACHGSMQSKETPWHKKHLLGASTDFSCVDCHKEINIKPRTLAGKVMIDRSICRGCHLKNQKFITYSLVHQKKNWINLHKISGGSNKEKCLECHKYKELNFCGTCHDKHPHNNKWIYGGHGKKAVKTEFKCLQCHEKETWCTTQCHEGVTLPHNIPKWSNHYKDEPDAPKWRKVHFRFAEKVGTKVCQRCHKFKSEGAEFCQKCHHQKFSKEMPEIAGAKWASKQGGMAYVKKKGAYKCWQCHDQEFCSYCHTNNKKPPYVNFEKKIKGSKG